MTVKQFPSFTSSSFYYHYFFFFFPIPRAPHDLTLEIPAMQV